MVQPVFQSDVPLSRHTTFRIGGPARYFLIARNSGEVAEAVLAARKMGLPWWIIGHGSNILAADEGFNGAVIAFRDDSMPRTDPSGTVSVSGGTALRMLVEYMAGNGMGGLEDLAGIPGTVGGAIAGNAGAYGTPISNSLIRALIMDNDGKVADVARDTLVFDYRSSSVKDAGSIVLEATFAARPTDVATLARTVTERLADRARKHPDPELVSTAGSYFKNPLGQDGKRIAAGRLLEEAGCKEFQIGGARLWHSHANIIVADQGTRAADVMRLAREMAARVGERLDVELLPEVQFLG
jgi:UDP-N-acetylmuramate dehydrogenase